MRKLIHNLARVWLILALAAAPLQVLASPLSVGSTPDCDMHLSDRHGAHTGEHAGHHTPDDSAATHCPACIDHACAGGNCGDHSCASVSLQQSLADTLYILPLPADARLSAAASRALASLTTSPLYRPPAA